jgi:hypothetical protein
MKRKECLIKQKKRKMLKKKIENIPNFFFQNTGLNPQNKNKTKNIEGNTDMLGYYYYITHYIRVTKEIPFFF